MPDHVHNGGLEVVQCELTFGSGYEEGSIFVCRTCGQLYVPLDEVRRIYNDPAPPEPPQPLRRSGEIDL